MNEIQNYLREALKFTPVLLNKRFSHFILLMK